MADGLFANLFRMVPTGDQRPTLSLFPAPEVRYRQILIAELQGLELRGLVGLRLNLFVPTRYDQPEPGQ